MQYDYNPIHERLRALWLRIRPLSSLATMLTVGCIVWYLFYPLSRDEVARPSSTKLAVNRSRVDLYLAFDLSRSVNRENFDGIERKIRSLIRTDIGDRISCVGFAATTNPLIVPAASQSGDCTAMRYPPPGGEPFFQSTRFDHLFENLHAAIYAERNFNRDRAKEQEPRRDFVVIVSDGVPGDEHQNFTCPEDFKTHGVPFIPRSVTGSPEKQGAVADLLNDAYPEQEPISVVLLIVENIRPKLKPKCIDEIQDIWRHEIRDQRFSPASFSGESAVRLIANQMDRARNIFLKPKGSIDAGARTNFDDRGCFSAKFDAWSYFSGGSTAIKSASLFGPDGKLGQTGKITTLDVVSSCDDDEEAGGPPTVVVAPPPVGELEGSKKSIPICFKFRNSRQLISGEQAYKIRLDVDDAKVSTCDLDIRPLTASTARINLKSRIKMLAIIAFFVLLALLTILLLPASMGKNSPTRDRMRGVANKIVLEPGPYWGLIFIAVMLAMIFALACLTHPYSIFFFPVVVVAGLIAYRFIRKPEDIWSEVAIAAIEVAILPPLEFFAFLLANRL